MRAPPTSRYTPVGALSASPITARRPLMIAHALKFQDARREGDAGRKRAWRELRAQSENTRAKQPTRWLRILSVIPEHAGQ